VSASIGPVDVSFIRIVTTIIIGEKRIRRKSAEKISIALFTTT
jgi:hypothetical protein